MDYGASHHASQDLHNMVVHSLYDEISEIGFGSGSTLPITHIGSIFLPTHSRSFLMFNVLCVSSMSRPVT